MFGMLDRMDLQGRWRMCMLASASVQLCRLGEGKRNGTHHHSFACLSFLSLKTPASPAHVLKLITSLFHLYPWLFSNSCFCAGSWAKLLIMLAY